MKTNDSPSMAFARFLRACRSVSLFALALAVCGRPVQAGSELGRIGAVFDPQCEAMIAEPPELEALLAGGPVPYFDAPIPRVIWLIDLCHAPEVVSAWRRAWHAYGARMHYEIRDVGPEPASPKGVAGQDIASAPILESRDCWVAQKMAGWHALQAHGGVWVSPSLAPPVESGEFIDFARLTPLRGLCVVTSARPQHLRRSRSGLTVSDTLVMAAAHHPVIEALVRQFPTHRAILEATSPGIHEAYVAGHVLLSRVTSGALTVLPRAFLARFDMCRGAKDADCGA